MKNILLAVLMVLPVILLSCVNSEKKKKEKSFLIGQSFAAYKYTLHGVKMYCVYRFIDEVNVEETARSHQPKGSIVGDIKTGTYYLDYPKISLSFLSSETNYESKVEGDIIDENTLRFLVMQLDGTERIVEYQKQ